MQLLSVLILFRYPPPPKTWIFGPGRPKIEVWGGFFGFSRDFIGFFLGKSSRKPAWEAQIDPPGPILAPPGRFWPPQARNPGFRPWEAENRGFSGYPGYPKKPPQNRIFWGPGGGPKPPVFGPPQTPKIDDFWPQELGVQTSQSHLILGTKIRPRIDEVGPRLPKVLPGTFRKVNVAAVYKYTRSAWVES
jgi:hypothetical protein